MTCYHPKKGFVVGINPETGKKLVKYKSYETQYIYSLNRVDWKTSFEDLSLSGLARHDDFLYRTLSDYPTYFCKDFITLPCGQCLGCRIDNSKEWANRMMLESMYHEHNIFLTLTYNDLYLPKSEYPIPDSDGEFGVSFTLRKRDFQLFMKRLRKAVEVHDPYSGKVLEYSKVRFYAAGEYGSKSMRPHYHAIIFNLDLHDLKLHHRSADGFNFYTSDLISRCWPFGFHLISDISWETCAYTARYVTKKLNGNQADFYSVFNVEPEFSLMSRRPGLGNRYYNEVAKDLLLDKSYIINFSTPSGGRTFKCPRYYDNLFDVEYPEILEDIKSARQRMAQNLVDMKLSKTNLSLLEMLEVEEDNFKHATRSLQRSDV